MSKGQPKNSEEPSYIRLERVKGLVNQARSELADFPLPRNLDLEARRNLDTAAYQLETAEQFLAVPKPQ
jgi:hypothetical protein